MLIYHNDEEHKIAVELGDKMVQHALDLDGTCKYASAEDMI